MNKRFAMKLGTILAIICILYITVLICFGWFAIQLNNNNPNLTPIPSVVTGAVHYGNITRALCKR